MHYAIVHSLTISTLPALITVLCYMAILMISYKLRRPAIRFEAKAKKGSSEQELNSLGPSQSQTTDEPKQGSLMPIVLTRRTSNKRFRRIFWRTTLLVSVYLLCWFPYNLSTVWSIIETKSYYRYHKYFSFTWFFIALNSALNPIIYRSTC